jgi:hypothetical protein
MKLKIQRRTVVVTSFEIDTKKIKLDQFKLDLIDDDKGWISDSLEEPDDLVRVLNENSDASSALFNFLNNYEKYGERTEYFLDGEEYSFN